MLGRIERTQDISRSLDPGMIILTAEKTEADLKAYVNDRIKNCENLQDENIGADFVREVRGNVEKDAQGNFLIASLKILAIAGQTRKRRIQEALDKTPEAIGPLLENLLNRLCSNPSDKEDLQALLTYVVWFNRPVTLGELALVPKFDPEYDPEDNFLNLEERVRTKYGDLFKVERNDRLTTEDLKRGLIRTKLIPLDAALSAGSNSVSLVHDIEQRNSSHSNEKQGDKTIFNSDSESTKLAIFHGKYRKFFRDDDWINRESILLDKHSANLRILRSCLKALTDDAMYDKYGTTTFTRHAAVWFPEYLGNVDLKRLPRQVGTEIWARLNLLFTHIPTRDRWVDKMAESGTRAVIKKWTEQEQYVAAIERFFTTLASDGEVIPGEDQVRDPTCHPRFIAENLAHAAARVWHNTLDLTRADWCAEFLLRSNQKVGGSSLRS